MGTDKRPSGRLQKGRLFSCYFSDSVLYGFVGILIMVGKRDNGSPVILFQEFHTFYNCMKQWIRILSIPFMDIEVKFHKIVILLQ